MLLPAGAQALANATFGQGTGSILLDDLVCDSSEGRLVDCFHNGVGVHNCNHSKDAGLRCQTPPPQSMMTASVGIYVPTLNLVPAKPT